MASKNDVSGGLDRRSALKMTAAAGAAAWVAPTISSQTVHASGGTCTPKCQPVTAAPGSGALTTSVTCSGHGVNRVATITGTVNLAQAFDCPCSDTPPEVVVASCAPDCNFTQDSGTVTFSTTLSGHNRATTIQFVVTSNVTCSDRSPDDGHCSRDCTTHVEVRVALQDNGNCRVGQSSLIASSSCP